MATTQMDPAMMQKILDSLSDVQRRSRRAKRLRGQQTGYEAMRDKEIELGGMTAPVTRGLTGTSRAAFDPIGSYIPNYQGMADKMIGGIGSIYGGKQADMAEDELNAARNPAVLEATEMLGQEGGPNDATIRAYLAGMGEDVKDIAGPIGKLRVQSTKTDSDGHVWAIMSDNSTRDTGIIEKHGFKVEIDPNTGQVIQIPTSSVGVMREAPMAGAAPPADGGGAAPPNVNIEGLSPEKNREISARAAFLESQGFGPAVIDAYIAQENANASVPQGAVAGPIEAMPNAAGPVPPVTAEAPPPIAAGAVPQPSPVPGTQVAPPPVAPPAPPAAPPAAPFRFSAAADVERAKEAAKIEAQVAAAPETTRVAVTKAGESAGAVYDEKTAAKAREMYPTAKQFEVEIKRSIDGLRNHEGLEDVVGKGLLAGVSAFKETPVLKHAGEAMKFLLRGTPAAGALARYQQLSAQVFMPAFKTLKGGGQITEKEGETARLAMGRMEQTTDINEFYAAMDEFYTAYTEGLEKLRIAAQGGYGKAAFQPGGSEYVAPPGTAPAAPAVRPALPPGFSWEE